MTENADFSQIPQATPEPPKHFIFSVVWIIPILAAVVAMGIAIERFLSEGPTITIVFKSAEGIEAGKTFLKYKDVNMGQVTKVKFSADYHKVVVTAKIDKSAEGLLVDDAKFWVVQPRVTLSGISGISTLLSGNYIGFEAGKSSKSQLEFQGLDSPPVVMNTEPGRQFILKAPTLGSLGIGSPLYYRQINVGRVIAYNLSPDGKSVNIRVFVNQPYEGYVTKETRFWQASGIDVSLGANGLSLKTQSALSLLIGGIAFEVPSYVKDDQPAKDNMVFTLYADQAIAMSQEDGIIVNYVLYFDESVRGLETGAPVMFRGLPIGEVTAVGLEYSRATADSRPRVEIALFPERFLKQAKLSRQPEDQINNCNVCNTFLRELVNRGLRAQLRNGNLLLGRCFIALDFFPKAALAHVDWKRETPRLPVVASDLVDLEAKVNAIMVKMDKIPFAKLGEELNATLVSVKQAANRLNTEVMPEARQTMEDMRRAIAAAEKAMNSSDQNLLGRDAPAQQELREALQEIARAARSISIFTEYLQQNPGALIRGKTAEKQ